MPILANPPGVMQAAPSQSAPSRHATQREQHHRCAATACTSFIRKPWPFCYRCARQLPAEMSERANQLAVDVAHAAADQREQRAARLRDHLRDCNEYLRRRRVERIEGRLW